MLNYRFSLIYIILKSYYYTVQSYLYSTFKHSYIEIYVCTSKCYCVGVLLEYKANIILYF